MHIDWAENKKAINQKMREFSGEMSELSRLFQRVVMKGDTAQRAKLKAILRDTNQKIIILLEEIDVSKHL